MSEPSRRDVLIVGAGPAGLALGACLAARGVRATLVEEGGAPGWSWLQRYESLRLHTTRRDSRLPLLAMPGGDRYPTAKQFAAYCTHYAKAFGLDVRTNARVARLYRREGAWLAETPGETFRATVAVVATGAHRVPHRPMIAGEERFPGALLHSTACPSGKPFHGRRVLVVGGGNTALDLIADLEAHGARPSISLRGPLHLMTRDMAGVNWHWRLRAALLAPLAVGRRAPGFLAAALRRQVAHAASARMRRRFADLEALGLRLADAATILRRVEAQRPPTVDHGAIALIRRGAIAVHGELVGLDERGARFAPPSDDPSAPGESTPFDAVIFATGFRADFDSLLDGEGDTANLLRFGEVPLLSAIRQTAPACARRVQTLST